VCFIHTYYYVSGTWTPETPDGSPELQVEFIWSSSEFGITIWLWPHQKKKVPELQVNLGNHPESTWSPTEIGGAV
jgi:hypothetical protein